MNTCSFFIMKNVQLKKFKQIKRKEILQICDSMFGTALSLGSYICGCYISAIYLVSLWLPISVIY